MDGGIGILIVFVLIGIISAVSSAAKKKSSSSNKQGEPQRRPMSEIQRAFMMMSGLEDDKEEQQARPVRTFNAPSPPPVRPAAPVSGEGSGGTEGKSDYGSVKSGSMVYDPLPSTSEGISFVSTVSGKGTLFESLTERVETDEDGNSTLMQHRLDDSADAADLRKEKLQTEMNTRPKIKLFQSQNDYLKAIIYSEILARRIPGQRRR
jgi:hypothetical protein